MNNDWIAQLKKGDEVVYNPAIGLPSIKIVDAVTKTGLVKVGCNLFKHDGYVRGGYEYSTTRISECTEEIKEKVLNSLKKRKLLDNFRASINSIKYEMLSLEQLEQINDIIDNG